MWSVIHKDTNKEMEIILFSCDAKVLIGGSRGCVWLQGWTVQQLLHLATQADHCVTNYCAAQLCHLPGPLWLVTTHPARSPLPLPQTQPLKVKESDLRDELWLKEDMSRYAVKSFGFTSSVAQKLARATLNIFCYSVKQQQLLFILISTINRVNTQ